MRLPPTYPRYASKSPTPKEVVEMIDLASNPRDKAIIAMMATSGLRIGTLFRLKYKHLKRDLEAGRIPVAIHIPADITKGRYMGYTTFINAEAVHYLKLWLKRWESLVGRRIRDDDYLFISLTDPRPDKHINPRSWISLNFKEIRRRVGVRKNVKRYEITPHGLRKFFKTQLIGRVPEEAVEYMMGHKLGAYTRIEDLGEDWLREQYIKGALRLRKTPLDKEKAKRMLREYALSIGIPEDEIDEYIRSAMTVIQAGYNIDEFIDLSPLRSSGL